MARRLLILTAATLLVARWPTISSGQQGDETALLAHLNDTKFDSMFNIDGLPTDELSDSSKCVPLESIPFCSSLGYNKTMMPNALGQNSQEDVTPEINMYTPLIKLGCSPDLKLFLCTVYAPMCFDQANGTRPLTLQPCRSLCESARRGCSDSIKQFNTEWPVALDCNRFKDREEGICVGKDDESISTQGRYNALDNSGSHNPAITRDLGFVCPKNFEFPSYTLHFNGKKYNNCALPCDDVLLDKSNAQIVRMTTGILAIICLISTIFTCATFLVDTKRFKYPARPIIIIAFCQFIVALCYLIGFVTSNKISCNDPREPPKSLPNMKMIRTTTFGNKKGICTLQFMALYFFQMSVMFWWLMMTVSWYMIARLKWAPEAVGNVARFFHLISWTIPGFLTIYLSVIGNIEGDSLTGTCYVSMTDQESIRAFVVYPTLTCLALGLVFLSLGFKSLWDSRETLRREYGKQTDEHHKLIIRIGLFSLLFIMFATLLIFCHHYEQINLNSWMLSWLSQICKSREYSIPCPKMFNDQIPHYYSFVAKYVATMATGIISAVFMLSEKTLSAYRDVAELCNYRI